MSKFSFKLLVIGVVASCMLFLNNISFADTNERQVTKATSSYTEESVFDVDYVDGVYKESENKSTKYLPFIHFVTDRLIVDEEVQKSGVSFAKKAIEINSKMQGLQVLFSSDSIRVNSDMEYSVLFADGDVVVDSLVSKQMIIFASDTVTLTENAKLKDDLIVVANNLVVEGKVEGSVLGTVANITVNGNIEKDLRVVTDSITLSSNDNIKNEIFVRTLNKDIKFDGRDNTNIVYVENEQRAPITISDIISVIISCIVMAALYLVINKVAKKDVSLILTNKLKNNFSKVVLFGAIAILASIPAVIILIMLCVVNLYVVALPIVILYIAFLIVAAILNVFVVGSMMYSYIKTKYIKTGGKGTDFLGAFCGFLVLSVLTKLPFVGAYIWIIMYILTCGILINIAIKDKTKDEVVKNEESK